MTGRAVAMVGLMLWLSAGGGGLPAALAVRLGEAPPPFALQDQDGRVRTLQEFYGRFVVLEWVNPDCPFVRKHYDSGNMQRLQRAATERGVVWLSISSSAPGMQGYLTPTLAAAFVAERRSAQTAVLLDPDGRVGRAYGAKTTPHMFVVSPNGVIVYQGAIDDTPSTDPRDVERAVNYVQRALDEEWNGTPARVPITVPYGCSVKYR